MKRKAKLVLYLSVILLVIFTVNLSNLKGHTASLETDATIDDFEGYSSTEELKQAYYFWSSSENGMEWSLSQEHFNDGTQSMMIVAAEPFDSSWTSLTHRFSMSDWSDSSGISFWIHNDADESLSFNFDVKSESKAFGQEGTFTVAVKEEGNSLWEEHAFESMLTVPEHFSGLIRIAWNQFTEEYWQCSHNCETDLNLALVNGIEFGYNPQAHKDNDIYLDSISLWGTGDQSLAPEWAAPSNTFQLHYSPAPIDNPLKGFLPFSESVSWRTEPNEIPYSMEFFYIGLNDIMQHFDEFDWSKLETKLNDVASRGNQAIFRVYLDYPHRPSGIPPFLLDLGLETKDYHYESNGGPNGTSVAPNYDDENLQLALTQFIEALGNRYDGDPRIGFIQAGLIGFWGEWHTHPQDGWTPANSWDGELVEQKDGRATDWMPSLGNQEAIVQGFDQSFDQTKILVRYPTEFNQNVNVGYHDDSFAFQTLPPCLGGEVWHFVGRLQENQEMDKWKTEPIGGEIRPEIQLKMWDNDPPQYIDEPIGGAQGEDYYKSLELTHASWLKIQEVFQTPLSGEAMKRAQEGSRDLGYEYYVSTAYVKETDGFLKAAINIQNTGIAPFYYDWDIEIAAKGTNGTVQSWSTDWDITSILPKDKDTREHNDVLMEWSSTSTLSEGGYDILVRVVNPLLESTSQAKSFHFANIEQEENGWLKIGEVEISNSR
ncbi:DUF4832 domain-containing protein [Shouchella sp. 1P09AA]|uniref:DUF4832 domain-containing protein n=1 Tax=unclassified Shouchella TaxID=2893065 RepID=UPI0039A028CE